MISIKYTAENILGEMAEFTLDNPMKARRQAFKQIRKWKAQAHSHVGLKLKLTAYENSIRLHEQVILNGDRMHSPEIILALHDELITLEAYGLEPPRGIISYQGMQISHVADDMVPIYYFTVS